MCSPKDKPTYENLTEMANHLKKLVPFEPLVGIICGSGLGPLADTLDKKIEVPYEQIPNFPKSTVKGHVGALVFGYISGVPLVVMKGRFHYYEGYPLWKVVMPVRVMKLLGVKYLIVTNAAGGVDESFKIGDVMMIKDHINFVGMAGNSPLSGPNDERMGPRFPPMNKAYDRQLLKQAKIIGNEIGLAGHIHEGVYAGVGGPTYESIAELSMLKTVGVSAVGMSTVHEVVAAVHAGLKVVAFSLITNEGIFDYDNEKIPNHKEVLEAAKSREGVLQNLVKQLIEYIKNVIEK